ncbi:hypothetical protein FSZ31_12615 [Sphingorhabdus soli]|uniref:Uncharacterized protein n=1 Tax=Flavisphingopyxis soli TaxID=2601267 RepID=A0A5C6U4H6_9SPHN|nr:hypothetical protein [Sphingorhabdus soli]TXC67804.1 hypothetical protein FSZ31_12615 [Sphingorhabdus soli]
MPHNSEKSPMIGTAAAATPEGDQRFVDIDAQSLDVVRQILRASGDSALARSYTPSCWTPGKG